MRRYRSQNRSTHGEGRGKDKEDDGNGDQVQYPHEEIVHGARLQIVLATGIASRHIIGEVESK